MISRRGVLTGLGGIAMVPTLFQTLAAQEAGSGTILVSIMLAGGNDGLNTVVPFTHYNQYFKLRTPSAPPANLALAYTEAALQTTAFDANPATPANAATSFAFAPSMTAMRALYATGNLAVINGVGLPRQELNPLSHSNAQTDWLTGLVNAGSGATQGWMGLALQKLGGGSLGATASMGGFSAVVNGAHGNGLVLNPSIDNYGFSYGYSDDYNGLQDAYHRMAVLPGGSPTSSYDRQQLAQALAAVKIVHDDARRERAVDYPVPSWLDYQLRDIGRLIVANSGIRGYFAVQGGYDTHSAQIQYQPVLLSQLGASIAQFHAYLKSKGMAQRVVVMTMSDFGRRPGANGDFGTDHGGATTSFVFGDRVKGGVFGTYPSLSKFDPNGNLAMSVDFRNVLSDVIVGAGGDPAPILGQTWPALGFI